MNEYRVLYVKEGDDGWWLEHRRGKWQLKQKEHKGTDLSWAKVVGECALEACGSRVWQVALDKDTPWADDEGIKIAVGGAAEAKAAAEAMVRNSSLLHYPSANVAPCV